MKYYKQTATEEAKPKIKGSIKWGTAKKHTTHSEQELEKIFKRYSVENQQERARTKVVAIYEPDYLVVIKEIMQLIQSEREKVLEEIKIIEPPEDVEKLKDKRQAFIAGQMNVILRAKWFPQKEESK